MIYFAMYTAVSSVLKTVLMSLSGVACLSLCLLYFFTHEEHLASRLFLFLCRVPLVKRFAVRFVEKTAESLNQIDREMVAFRKRKKPFLLSFFLEYLTWCMEVLEYFLIFRMLGANLSIWQSALALSVASMIGNLMFFVPMQVGSREGGLALVLRWFGVRGSLGVSAALFARIREIFYIALGVLMILTSSHKSARKKKKENE